MAGQQAKKARAEGDTREDLADDDRLPGEPRHSGQHSTGKQHDGDVGECGGLDHVSLVARHSTHLMMSSYDEVIVCGVSHAVEGRDKTLDRYADETGDAPAPVRRIRDDGCSSAGTGGNQAGRLLPGPSAGQREVGYRTLGDIGPRGSGEHRNATE